MTVKYDALTNRLGKFLLGDKRTGRPPLIDFYEHGRMDRHGQPKPINLKWQLENKRVGQPKKLSRTGIAAHLRFDDTIYYRSNRASGFAFLKIDIDAKEGEHDALAVAEAIQQFYLPEAYHEPSTGGKGRHLYAIIAFDLYEKRPRVNRWLQCVGISLRELMKAHGFRAKIDPITCRTFSVYGEDAEGKRFPVCMGQFSKLPRPRTLKDMDRLEAAPIYFPSALNQIIRDYKKLRAERNNRAAIEVQGVDAPADPRAVEAHRTHAQAFKGMKAHDPRSRAVHSVMGLARRLGRLPSVVEARLFYEGSGLATIRPSGDTPQDIRRRERRLSGAIKHVEKTFDVARAGKGFDLASMVPIICQHVRPEHRAYLKYDYGISDDALSLTLHVIELASFERKVDRDEQWTCGNERIIGMFRKMKAEAKEHEDEAERQGEGENNNNTCVLAPFQPENDGQEQWGCNRQKAVAMKNILIRAGLAEVYDESYRPGTRVKRKGAGENNNNTFVLAPQIDPDVAKAWADLGYNGRCKRVVVGPAHPRRQEWERERQELEEWVITGRRTTDSTAGTQARQSRQQPMPSRPDFASP